MKDVWNELTERYEITDEMPHAGISTRIVGSAFKKGCEEHFVIKLKMFPFTKYYLKPDVYGKEEYIIFSGYSKSPGNERFFYSVGTARKTLNNYICLRFPDLKQWYYLRLTPRDYHYESKAA